MNLDLSNAKNKTEVFQEVRNYMTHLGFKIITEDQERPWGGFFVIDESQADRFIDTFFTEVDKNELLNSSKLSPKILLVAPSQRLSWQYHHRRAELWKLIYGEADVITSDTDEQLLPKHMVINELLQLKQGERHRLIGAGNWGIVSEIWKHTDKDQPSDEEDIVRVSDDFGR